MIEKTNDILEIFFREIKEKGKYKLDIRENTALIIPREEERYYKPIIRVPDLNYLRILLLEYINSINEFNKKNTTKLDEYQDLSYILNIMLFNMTSSDADDLNKFLENRISFLLDETFEDYSEEKKVFESTDATFYAKRECESFGLETPYIMTFKMKRGNEEYNLPIIRYAINNDGTCYIYAVQIGRGRICETSNDNYKNIINKVNQGVKQNRNISPSFVLVFSMFIKLLKNQGINKIVIPDFLFNRYKKYYKANTTSRSNDILSRMFHSITTLTDRIDDQVDGFNITGYPFEIDSYYHIELNDLKSNNKILNKLFQ